MTLPWTGWDWRDAFYLGTDFLAYSCLPNSILPFPAKLLGVTSSSLTPVFPTTPESNDPTKDIKLQGFTVRAFSTGYPSLGLCK